MAFGNPTKLVAFNWHDCVGHMSNRCMCVVIDTGYSLLIELKRQSGMMRFVWHLKNTPTEWYNLSLFSLVFIIRLLIWL